MTASTKDTATTSTTGQAADIVRADQLDSSHLGRTVGLTWEGGHYVLPLLGLRPTLLVGDDVLAEPAPGWVSRAVHVLLAHEGLGPQWLDLPPEAPVTVHHESATVLDR